MIPVILSGGGGTRLWPVSRQSYPKQFCDLLDESLFNKTAKRLEPLGAPWVVTVREMKTLTDRSLKELNLSAANAVYEPFGKNTAAAVALICSRFEKLGNANEIVGIFPADQLIDDDESFRKIVRAGETLASSGHIVTLGIKPTYPATGYGYIETAGALKGGVAGSLYATGFREKPNEQVAQEFLSRGGFFWNAGMFIFRVSTMIEAFKLHAPDIWQTISRTKEDLSNLDEVYAAVRSTSIDYAIMERLPHHACLPCDFGWTDLGSWDSMIPVLEESNAPRQVVQALSENNFVVPYGEKTYGFVGVNDLIVVDTADALLVAQKGSSESVKLLVDQMKAAGNAKVVEHRFEIRPWGRFEVLADTDTYKAKRIEVDPGAQISYQSHAKRAENWIFISGSGEVTLNGSIVPVTGGRSVFVEIGTKHRVRNVGSKPLVFVEVQTGSYFGEDDIVRYQDDYDRVPNA